MSKRQFRNGVPEASGYDLWMTPPEVLDPLREEFGELFDPCPADWPGAPDGLAIDWPTHQVCFVNPPYSQIAAWCAKCAEQCRRGCTVVLLMAARTDTRYFHDNINGNAEVRFLKGRVKFVHPDGRKSESAPFPSILCVFRGKGRGRGDQTARGEA